MPTPRQAERRVRALRRIWLGLFALIVLSTPTHDPTWFRIIASIANGSAGF